MTSPSEVTIGISQTMEDSVEGSFEDDGVDNTNSVPPSPKAPAQSYDSLSETIALVRSFFILRVLFMVSPWS